MVEPLLNVAASLQFSFPPTLISNLDGQGIRIDWHIEKTIGPSPDMADIIVYNLNKPQRETLNLALQDPFGAPTIRVSLAIGWAGLKPIGVPQLVFLGEIWTMEPEVKQATDVMTILTASDGAQSFGDTPPDGGSAAKIAFQLVIGRLLGVMRLTPSPASIQKITERADSLPLPTFQFTGDESPVDYLNEVLASLGLTWGIQDGLFVVFQNGLLPAGPGFASPILQPNSGLLGWQERDDGGLNFEALAQPIVKPGSGVVFRDESGKQLGSALMRIERIEFDGSTMGQSTMRGIARRLEVF